VEKLGHPLIRTGVGNDEHRAKSIISTMINTYEIIRADLHLNKFSVGELLFADYKCPIEQEVAGVWTPVDFSFTC